VQPVAIVGMACMFPEAGSLAAFWENVVAKRDCIRDVPPDRWRIEDYYDPNPGAPDKTYSKRGGFIPDVAFDPVEFGLPPNILEVTDNAQLLALLVARRALEDAGYGAGARAFDRERTGVILGVGSGLKMITPLTSRLQYPVWEKVLRASGLSETESRAIVEKMKLAYVPWEENSFPGMLGNVVAGRIANRLDLGGANCTVDAACAASLAAVRMALGELGNGQSDMMITGGVDLDNSPFMYLSFSKTPAFTAGDRVRPFDAESDGMLVGEGIGMLVLKRLADAERDGDRVYAVIRGIGASSDGRYKSIYAPRSEGQARALERAYAAADVPRETVGLIEAHGTGTVAGDLVETTTLRGFFAAAAPASVALGSVKSQIGHTKSAAGAAGLIKAALALHHKVLPATINVERPHSEVGPRGSPLYVNTETRPWLPSAPGVPRRAGVSSFGFGGTNYHVVLEEHEAEQSGAYRLDALPRLIVLDGPGPDALGERCRQSAAALRDGDAAAAFAALAERGESAPIPAEHARVGVVADDAATAAELLGLAADEIAGRGGAEAWEHPAGLVYRARSVAGAVVALFPGQGSQYVDMGRELAAGMPEVRASFAAMDALRRDGEPPLSSVVYPPPAFDDAARRGQAEALQRTDRAQPAIGAFCAGLFRVLRRMGFRPDAVAGHSFGELTALWAAGALSDRDFAALADARGRAMAPPAERPDFDAGAMLAVGSDVSTVRAALEGLEGVQIANDNAPRQVVLAGGRAAVAQAAEHLAARGITATPLPVAAAFHTPLVGHARAAFAEALAAVELATPVVPVYSNASAEPYEVEPAAIRARLAAHVLEPVRFREGIEALYAAGGRVFVEVGPRSVLSNLVREILADRPHHVVALNPSRRPDAARQLAEGLLRLRVAGLALDARDPYRRETVDENTKKGGAVVVLNGANYVSDKTRQAFERALEGGHAAGVNGAYALPVPPAAPPIQPTAAPVAEVAPAPVAPPPVGAGASAVEVLAQLHGDALRAHQQMLADQSGHTRQFLELVQQQQALLLQAGAQVPPAAHETLARSLTLFQELQRDTLRTHERYLEYQAEHTRAIAGLLAGQPFAFMPAAPRATAPPVAPSPVVAPPPTVAPPATVAPPPALSVAPIAKAAFVPAPVDYAAAPPVPVDYAAPPPPVPPAPPTAPTAPSLEAVTRSLLDVVADKTGYPVDTLELTMDLEADLGIDSIKRVEILGAMRELYPSAPHLKPEELAELRTLDQIVVYLSQRQPATEAVRPAVAPTPTNGAASAAAWRTVELQALPEPDRLETGPPPGTCCLVTDDGTALTGALVERLTARGWAVAVMAPPIGRDEAGVAHALAELVRAHGPVGAFVHLNPATDDDDPLSHGDEAIARAVFLLASALAPALTAAASGAQGRAAFAVVTRLDGALGITGYGSATAGGLLGLVKTLALEWPAVFCRGIDVAPSVAPPAAADLIVAELLDPNRLVVEVGVDGVARVTLGAAALAR
jgi:acyl transferase domain-containing protein/acyl carrier protein